MLTRSRWRAVVGSIGNASVGRNLPGSPALTYFSIDTRPSRAVRSPDIELCTHTRALQTTRSAHKGVALLCFSRRVPFVHRLSRRSAACRASHPSAWRRCNAAHVVVMRQIGLAAMVVRYTHAHLHAFTHPYTDTAEAHTSTQSKGFSQRRNAPRRSSALRHRPPHAPAAVCSRCCRRRGSHAARRRSNGRARHRHWGHRAACDDCAACPACAVHRRDVTRPRQRRWKLHHPCTRKRNHARCARMSLRKAGATDTSAQRESKMDVTRTGTAHCAW
jgi:hypothetical protein